ncbi:NAD(P)H-hydrate dehydratase [Clostridium fermenticellae]|uniref:Bifunctional NAD(P)H-hydrate repair enzyme n=1 Tax=Clostridium fermenticellae TaxID=2068654 RepID=A0A386H104_9CLOT|nr:NAD(P)H-hydrate dehydratase [Clostridium fermenticellae]
MKIATVNVMRKIDSYCIEELGIPGIVLMENAALKVIENLKLDKFDRFCIICSKGNNGGDGFSVARHLTIMKKCVDVFLIGNSDRMSHDCKVNYNILKNIGVNAVNVSSKENIDVLGKAILQSDIVVDAMFGTGLSRDISGIFDSVITLVNEYGKYIVAIDAPSGFESDTGKILGNCIKADETVTFGLYKKGFLSYGADKFTGKISVKNIGIPQFAVDKFTEDDFITNRYMIKRDLRVRDKYSHKGDYGRVMIFAGSAGFTGAAYICTQGAVRCGSGLVTLCCSKNIQELLSSKLIEAMTISTDDDQDMLKLLKKCDAVAFGPGLKNSEATLDLLKKVIFNYDGDVVLDADGLNVLSGKLNIIKKSKCKFIFTPHAGEMSRITGLSVEYINENRIDVSKKFARDNHVVVLLKGYNTVVTDGYRTFINPTGNSSMASGGMGDCLTGIIVSLLGQGYDPLEAAYIGAFLHGYCGDKLSRNMYSVNASHIIDQIPFAIKELLS